MQLIKITNIPMEYKFSVEPARLEMKQAQNPSYKMTQDFGQMNIQTDITRVQLDSTRMRASLNLRNTNDFAHYYGSKGMQQVYDYTGESVQFGNQMAQIQDGVTISQLVQQKMLAQPTTYTTFIPSAGIDMSWRPQEVHLDYEPTSQNFDWQVMRNQMDYVPGKFTMDIIQYPKVQIEYLGEPMYVPPSSAPGYEEESA